jgi:hypothetical protein
MPEHRWRSDPLPTASLTRAVGAVGLATCVLSRTTRLLADSFDVGHWDCPLGTTAISTEPYDALSGST